VAQYLGLSQEVTGAWLGGSIDTTGAVVASGTLVGETALKISTIIKFSQNVLLGLAAFAISIYWTYTNHASAKDPNKKPTLVVIWERFPKFVIGFIAASLLFSFFLDPALISSVKGSLKTCKACGLPWLSPASGWKPTLPISFGKTAKSPCTPS
jgi:uncharacterized membrane protein YadS